MRLAAKVFCLPGVSLLWLAGLSRMYAIRREHAPHNTAKSRIVQRFREQQEKTLENYVESGKLTKEQMEKAREAMERFSGPGITKLIASVGAVAASFVNVMGWGFVLWALGHWVFKGQFTYMKAVEMAGLAVMISVLGALVTLLLTVAFGNMFATPSLALLVHEFDPTSKTHVVLAAINLFKLWLLGVLAVALTKLCGVSFGQAALAFYGF